MIIHLKSNKTEFVVHEVIKLHLDCLTDVTIKSLKNGESQRVYHRDLIKFNK